MIFSIQPVSIIFPQFMSIMFKRHEYHSESESESSLQV